MGGRASSSLKGSNGGAGSQANTRADINDDPLVLRSAMEQDYTNWHAASLNYFEFIILPLGKTAIGCRWVLSAE
jgi:hypothetical protein